MVCVRSDTISTLIAGGSDACSCGRARLIASTVRPDVGAGLSLDFGQQDRALAVQPAGERLVLRRAFIARPMSRMRTGAPLR